MGARYDTDRKVWFSDFWYHYPSGRRERFRLDAPVNTRQGALAYERQVRNEIAAGTWRRNEPATVRDFAREFLVWAENNLKPSTRISYEKILRNNLVPFLGHVRLGEIGAEVIERYKSQRAVATPKTICNELTCLGSLMRLAVEYGRIPVAPKLRKPKVQRHQDRAYRWLERDEAEKLLAAPSTYSAMIAFALHTGLRLGELQALSWEQIDIKARRIVVSRNYAGGIVGTPKGNRSRVVDLDGPALDALSRVTRRLHCELVFTSATGRMVSQSDASKGLRRACKAAKIADCGWHVLRHTFASWLVQGGVPLRQVQELLGHSTIAVTERYSHLSPASGASAVRVLEAR
jgi:integrase